MTNPIYHMDLEQGTDEWLQARLGVLTASTMKGLFTKALAPSKGATPETLMYRILSERINGWTPDNFQSWDMARGHFEEELALGVYCSEREVVTTCGFVTNDQWGFTLGFSPDALVGDDGLIEVKSAKAEFQLRTIFNSMIDGAGIPDEHKLQCQTGLLVTGRKWIDFISYSNGMPMMIAREYPDPVLQSKIIEAATNFEAMLQSKMSAFTMAVAEKSNLIETERNDFTGDDAAMIV